ncbi:MAG: putative rane protein [Ilumatobacteraceae bacterium]|nr:putative rane protein [Ilumatobacteraceae bacterium]
MAQFDFGVLVLRLAFGLSMAYHGYNKFSGPGGLTGTAGWFGSIGMKWPKWQARLAASTEVGAGLLLAAGLLTPLAAAGMIGIMVVAIWVAHWKIGYFMFKPGGGWEYCAAIIAASFVIGTVGPGKYSLDHAFGIDWTGWTGCIITAVVGFGGGLAQLGLSYRPPAPAPAASSAS